MSNEDDIAIKVEGVNKTFKLPHERAESVKHLFINFFRPSSGYEKQQVLKDISFEVKKGEFFGIVGRNGSGKSTLLKLLAGVYSPDTGHIQTSGKLVPFIELGVGFNPELTGRENVYLNGALLGFSEEEVDGFYDQVVEFAELERFMDQKLKNYSSGMQVRLAFSMAVRAEADILLIDEVLAVGDADFQRKCFEYFKTLKKNKKTVVFVGHSMDAIREYCDRGFLIENGEIIESGNGNKIANSYTKMFIDKNKDAKKKSQGERFGDQEIEIKSVQLEPKNTISDDNKEIIIKTTIHAKIDSDDVLVGFKILNPQGGPLLGTNNNLLGQKINKIKKDQRIELVWHIQNIFNDGNYSVDVSIVSSSGKTYDWWTEAINFEVMRLNRTGFLTVPPIKLSMKTVDSK